MTGTIEEVETQSHEDWAQELMERRRAAAYAHPETGSDRFFSQAARLDALGQVEKSKAARAEGLARYNEIKEIHSMPNDKPNTSLPVPQGVTMRQAHRELHERGMLDSALAVIESLPEPERAKAKIDWERSSELHRSNPFVSALGSALGLSSADLDELFIEAAKIP